jgi:hypothetical protein
MPQRIPINYIKLYHRGKLAQFNGNTYAIDHVTIRGDKLFVHLDGVRDPIPVEQVGVEVTAIDFNRDNGGPKCYVLAPARPSEPISDQNDLPDDWVL